MLARMTRPRPPGSILIVDDEIRLGDALRRTLALEGYDAFYEPDAEEALRALRARPFDVLLTDLVMPGIDGLELMRRAKRIRPGCEVVVMTAFATVDTAREALKRGAVDYLTKPFSVERDLFPLIRDLLATPGGGDGEIGAAEPGSSRPGDRRRERPDARAGREAAAHRALPRERAAARRLGHRQGGRRRRRCTGSRSAARGPSSR